MLLGVKRRHDDHSSTSSDDSPCLEPLRDCNRARPVDDSRRTAKRLCVRTGPKPRLLARLEMVRLGARVFIMSG